MSDAKAIISAMLKEDTGVHMMDSGGDGGRSWQLNQKRDFEKEPASILEIDYGHDDIIISKNTYHFLTRFFTSTRESERLNAEMMKFADRPENRDMSWLEIMNEFYEKVLWDEIDEMGWDAYNVNGHEVVNTYNFESSVDQILQYMLFSWRENKPYIMLQIHGGADARGGYTMPHIFAFDFNQNDSIDDFFLADGDYSVDVNGEQWFTDDHGQNWYQDGSSRRSFRSTEFAEYIRIYMGIAMEENVTEKYPGDLNGSSIPCPVGRRIRRR